ncbi:hypothetical protein UlMin_042496 [Ulmus minor]
MLLTSLRRGPFTEKMTCECPQYLFANNEFLKANGISLYQFPMENPQNLWVHNLVMSLDFGEMTELKKKIISVMNAHFTACHLSCCDWVGYFSYDTVRYVEKRKVPFSMAPKDERNLADIHLGLYDDVLVFDHVEKKVYVIHWVRLDRLSSIEMAYEDGVKHLASLLAGVQSLTPRTFADPFEIYRALRVVNPSPYMTHLQARGCILVASSPEILTRVNKNLELQLLSNEKQCAEHIMLVDLGQNDVGKMVSAFIDEFSHLSVLFLMPCHATPCYSTLHYNIPMQFLDCTPSSNNPKLKRLEMKQDKRKGFTFGYVWTAGRLGPDVRMNVEIDKLLSGKMRAPGHLVLRAPGRLSVQVTKNKFPACFSNLYYGFICIFNADNFNINCIFK